MPMFVLLIGRGKFVELAAWNDDLLAVFFLPLFLSTVLNFTPFVSYFCGAFHNFVQCALKCCAYCAFDGLLFMRAIVERMFSLWLYTVVLFL